MTPPTRPATIFVMTAVKLPPVPAPPAPPAPWNHLAVTAGPHGQHAAPGPALILLVLLVLGGLSYGAIRLNARRQSAAPKRSTAPSPPPLASSSRPAVARPEGGWAVEAHGLMKRFGTNVAVDDVELLVPRGAAFGYLGPNGAGKTTLIRTLLGLTRPNQGAMSLLGVEVPAQRSQALARVGAIVDEPRFHPHLTGQQNLRLLAAARCGDAASRIVPSLTRVGLADRAGDKVASYSMGMRQRLGVAACLLGDPELLILDEPMNGLDPAGMHEMRAMIESLRDEGRTVMLSSHLLDEIERTCDAVAIVDRGRVIRQGSIGIAAGTTRTQAGLTVTLPGGTSRELIADLNRRLVEAGIGVYGLQEIRTSLEDWFLSVTSRLGDQS
jgi:ABC-2 type transport system ATP-binding protein